jgi:hypothetical protein
VLKTLSSAERDWIAEGESLPRREALAVLRTSRRACRLAGRLISGRRNHAAQIMNLSSRGAMARGGRMPREGENVVLQIEGLFLAATVMWTQWPSYGLRFRDLLGQEQVDRLIENGPEGKHFFW